MKRWADVLWLASRGLWHHRSRALLVSLSLTLAWALPLALAPLGGLLEARWASVSSEVPAVVGARGSPTSLVLSAVWLTAEEVDLPTIPERIREELLDVPGIEAAALYRRGVALGRPVIGWSAEGARMQGWALAEGRWPGVLGEAVLGARVAREAQVALGDRVVATAARPGDPLGSAPVRLRVVGVMEEVHAGVDGAVWTTLETTWALDGAVHGHTEDGEEVEGSLVGFQPSEPAAAPERWHLHGDRAALPVHAVWVRPADARARDQLAGRIALREDLQLVDPQAVASSFLRKVGRVERLLWRLGTMWGAATGLLVALVLSMIARERGRELRLLQQLGASRRRIAAVWLAEAGGVLLASLVGAALLAWASLPWLEASMAALAGG